MTWRAGYFCWFVLLDTPLKGTTAEDSSHPVILVVRTLTLAYSFIMAHFTSPVFFRPKHING